MSSRSTFDVLGVTVDKVLIMVPAYKRPEALALSLSSLCSNTERDLFEVDVVVGINAPVEENKAVVEAVKSKHSSGTFRVHKQEYDRNIGKSAALNRILADFLDGHRFVLNMDSDMVIKRSWMQMLEKVSTVDYDLVGFGGTRFWSHSPNIDENYQHIDPYRLYRRAHLAGGLMLFSLPFLKSHKIHGYGGVYGGDDAYSCTQTEKKYVVYWNEDWLEHDPLHDSTPGLHAYEEKKREHFSKKVFVFQEGWDN
jgi:glycosyltransferase involved in cell wall biosynthesis